MLENFKDIIICVQVAKLLHQVSHVLLVQLPTQTTNVVSIFISQLSLAYPQKENQIQKFERKVKILL